MILSQRQKNFSEVFSAFPKFTSNFEYFQTKVEPHSLFFTEIIDWKEGSYLKAQKNPYQNTYSNSTL